MQAMHSRQSLEYKIFHAPVGVINLKCVIKNTFLELDESADSDPSSNMHGARLRSSSESRVAFLTRREVDEAVNGNFNVVPELTKDTSFSTISSTTCSTNDDGSSSTRTDTKTPSEFSGASSPGSTGEASPCHPLSPASISHQEDSQVPSEVFEALQSLTDLVEEQKLKREDLMNNEIVEQLYPYIPVDDEGCATSLGSLLHAEGVCKPCAFLKKNRCHKGELCVYCHFEHESKDTHIAPRKSKKKRMRENQARHRQESQQEKSAGIRNGALLVQTGAQHTPAAPLQMSPLMTRNLLPPPR